MFILRACNILSRQTKDPFDESCHPDESLLETRRDAKYVECFHVRIVKANTHYAALHEFLIEIRA